MVVHAAYVLNLASAEEEKWARASAGLAKELERSTALGVGGVCFHPGAATDGDRDAGVARVAKAMTQALRTVHGGTKLLVENTAGAGQTVGRTAEEVGAIRNPQRLRQVAAALKFVRVKVAVVARNDRVDWRPNVAKFTDGFNYDRNPLVRGKAAENNYSPAGCSVW